MQETAVAIEREARHRLPLLLAELLDVRDVRVESARQEDDRG
jgi:hypothetical protein